VFAEYEFAAKVKANALAVLVMTGVLVYGGSNTVSSVHPKKYPVIKIKVITNILFTIIPLFFL